MPKSIIKIIKESHNNLNNVDINQGVQVMKILSKGFMMSIVGVGLMLSGCASTTEGLQKATANKVSGVLSSDVVVYDIDRGATDVKWGADVKGTKYKCESDDMVRNVNCIKAK